MGARVEQVDLGDAIRINRIRRERRLLSYFSEAHD